MDIVTAICDTQDTIQAIYPQLQVLGKLKRDVSFVTTQELEDRYPDLSPRERENVWLKEHRTAFIMGIGGTLKSGKKHDGRAPDYDDWSLNGDIFFWDDLLDCAMEISSMGIRVDPEAMDRQLRLAGCDDRFHAAAGQSPYRRSAGLHLGREYHPPLRGSGHHASLRREWRG